ncbi:MAG: riboflavin synthase, partial [Patescibacteria group bacterium]
DRVNIERSASLGDEIGGHLLSGHIMGTAEITDIDHSDNNHRVTFRAPREWMKYIFSKGFIALDGCSLTIVEVDKTASTFTVWLIPETLRVTTFGFKKVGDKVNVEIDSRTQTIVDTVQALMKSP